MKITESVDAIAKYLYEKCGVTLSIPVKYADFKKDTNTELTREQFTKCIWYMIRNGYVSRPTKALPLGGKEDENYLELSPQLIRDVENSM